MVWITPFMRLVICCNIYEWTFIYFNKWMHKMLQFSVHTKNIPIFLNIPKCSFLLLWHALSITQKRIDILLLLFCLKDPWKFQNSTELKELFLNSTLFSRRRYFRWKESILNFFKMLSVVISHISYGAQKFLR